MSRYSHLTSIPASFNSNVPTELRAKMEEYKEDLASQSLIGLEWAINQEQELIFAGTRSMHFYATRGARINELIEGIKQ